MNVDVRVFATLRRYTPDIPLDGVVMDLEPGLTLAELRDRLGLPANEVKIVMRNSLQADMKDVINDGDRVAFIPAVAGG
jgi:molybdopterin converting factor small subunit